MELEKNMVVWIDGLDAVLDFMNLIKDENPDQTKEGFAFLKNEDIPRKNYSVNFDDGVLFFTILRMKGSDYRLIASRTIECIDQFLKEEESENN